MQPCVSAVYRAEKLGTSYFLLLLHPKGKCHLASSCRHLCPAKLPGTLQLRFLVSVLIHRDQYA